MTSRISGSLLLLFTILFLSAGSASAQSVNDSKFGKGLQFVAADSSFSLKFSTRFQVLYQGGEDATQKWDDTFRVRRARLKFEGFAYSPKLEYKIQLGLSANDFSGLDPENNPVNNILLDAVARWEMLPGLSLWVGQTKLPGNRERVTSSQKLQFVDRSLLNARFNIDRDAGLQLHHEHNIGQLVLREIGAVTIGEGRNLAVTNLGGYSYTGRFELLPFGTFASEGDYVGSDIAREQTPKLSLGATYNYNDDATREGGQLGRFLSERRDLRTLFLDAIFKYRGFSTMVEYADKKAENGPAVSLDELGDVDEAFVTGKALNAQAGYLFKNNWEVAGRYTTYAPTAVTGRNDLQQYTLGLSKYIVGHNLKVQSGVTLQQEQTRKDQYQFRIQMELSL